MCLLIIHKSINECWLITCQIPVTIQKQAWLHNFSFVEKSSNSLPQFSHNFMANIHGLKCMLCLKTCRKRNWIIFHNKQCHQNIFLKNSLSLSFGAQVTFLLYIMILTYLNNKFKRIFICP